MLGDTEDGLFAELFSELDAGNYPTAEEFAANHPAVEAAARRAWGIINRYRTVRAPCVGDSEGRPGAVVANSPPASELTPGTCLGDFEIVDVISRGGMGTVYRARQLSLDGRLVALKVHDRPGTDDLGLARFHREVRSLARVRHPHLAEIYGFDDRAEHLYFAMRLVEGCDLTRVLQQLVAIGTPPDAPTRRRIVARTLDVARGLAALHAAGLVHRDVKPANIVLSGAEADAGTALDQSAVLVDFGLVRRAGTSSLTESGASPRTPAYASPEQTLGAEVDARSDVFSLGATLHDLLAARAPEARLHASAGLEPLVHLVAGIEPDLAAIVTKATEWNLTYRYASAKELAEDLNRFLTGREVSARRPRSVERIARSIHAHSGTLARALVLGVLGSSVVVLLLFIGSWATRISAANSYWAMGQADRAVIAVEGVAHCIVGAFGSDQLPVLVERASARQEADPIVQTIDRLRSGDLSAALAAAATPLRLHGPSADPTCRAWLETMLRRCGTGGLAAVEQSAVLALWSRLLMEAPPQTPDESASWTTARIVARSTVGRILNSASAITGDALNAFAILSVIGDASDLDFLLTWALAPGLSRNSKAFAISMIEIAIRRARRFNVLPLSDVVAARDRLIPSVVEGLNAAASRPSGLESDADAALTLYRTLAFAGRAAAPLDLEDWWSRVVKNLDPNTTVLHEITFGLRCAIRPAGVDRELLALAARPGSRRAIESLGTYVGYYDIESLTDEVRSRLAGPSGLTPQDLESWEAQVAGARRIAHADDHDARPDPETLLGALSVGNCLLEAPVIAAADGLDAIAIWDFRQRPYLIGGAALPITATDGGMDREGANWFLKLGGFGSATATLGFRCSADADMRRPPILELWAHRAIRHRVPFHGTAIAAVSVDGEFLCSQRVLDRVGEPVTVWLPHELLTAGAHRVTIELSGTSSTTLRIQRAVLRLAEPSAH